MVEQPYLEASPGQLSKSTRLEGFSKETEVRILLEEILMQGLPVARARRFTDAPTTSCLSVTLNVHSRSSRISTSQA
jgi:hypothetical protein